ncbi:hypothetical protein FRB99_005672 [Tulasnella sp. 403]|nr:hypothetical protein FRB99_005672 [Tulasnella sp. 403]
MHLARHSISSTNPISIVDARFDADCKYFAAATPHGFGVYKTWPLKLMRKRDLTGTLSKVLPLHATNIVFLVGGGRNPRYPPNKVIFWDEAIGKEVVELEFKEQVRGLIAMATAPGSTLLAVPGRQIGHVQLIRLPPCPSKPLPSPPPDRLPQQSTSRSPPPPTKHPVSIIVAHTTSLTTIGLPPSGSLVSTTSSRGTLIRVWDTKTGKLVRELRRGSDYAIIYGVSFRQDEREVCVWSDKGTVHLFKLNDTGEGASNRQSTFSPLKNYLHKYFSSQWSYAHYRLPSSSKHIALTAASGQGPDPDAAEEERCTVGWIEVPVEPPASGKQLTRTKSSSSQRNVPPPQNNVEYQLVALTYSGGWYRLSVPSVSTNPASIPSSASETGSTSARRLSSPAAIQRGPSSITSSRPTEKGKERARNKERNPDDEPDRPRRDCILVEFKRFGRWDGWM